MWPFAADAVNLQGSPHDLSGDTGDTGEICIFCHTPHRGSPSADRPLWNHTLTTQNLTWSPAATERGTTLPTTITGADIAGSRACLSCHDGTVALGSVTVWWNSGTNASESKNFSMTAETNRITAGGTLATQSTAYINPGAMQGNHPIGLSKPANKTGFTSFKTVSGSDAVQYDANGKVQCGSCHNPHLYDLNITYGPFLRKTNVNSQLCTTCHDL
jgi:hypothetical protein